MNGNKLLVDTKVIIHHLAGDSVVERMLQNAWVYVSGITYAELLATQLTDSEEAVRRDYLENVYVIHTNDFICETAASLRRKHRIKLPDALIAATSLFLDLPIVTFDTDFDAITDLRIVKLIT